jgi:hypothetical protein
MSATKFRPSRDIAVMAEMNRNGGIYVALSAGDVFDPRGS